MRTVELFEVVNRQGEPEALLGPKVAGDMVRARAWAGVMAQRSGFDVADVRVWARFDCADGAEGDVEIDAVMEAWKRGDAPPDTASTGQEVSEIVVPTGQYAIAATGQKPPVCDASTGQEVSEIVVPTEQVSEEGAERSPNVAPASICSPERTVPSRRAPYISISESKREGRPLQTGKLPIHLVHCAEHYYAGGFAKDIETILRATQCGVSGLARTLDVDRRRIHSWKAGDSLPEDPVVFLVVVLWVVTITKRGPWQQPR